MRSHWLCLIVLLAAGWMLANAGRAEGAPKCSVTAATMDFGNFNVYAADLAISGIIDMTCSGGSGTRPMATLSGGESGTISDRYMRCISGACLSNGFSGDELHYDLYTTSSHATVWGTATVPSTPADCGNATCAWTIFGLIPEAIGGGINDVSVGGYSDTVTITISY